MKHRSTILVAAAAVLLTGAALVAQSGNDLYSLALEKERTQGYTEAIKLYQTILDKHGSDAKLAVKTLLRLGSLYEKVGSPDVRQPYERIVKEYAREKAAVEQASSRLAALRGPRPREVRVDLVATGRDVNFNQPSPDGRYLVRATRNAGVFLYDTMLDVERQLGTDAGNVKFPIFTADGKRVIYARFEGGRGEIRSINVDGSDIKTLFSTTQYTELELSAVSPDGKRIALGLVLRDGAGPVGPNGGRAPFWQIGIFGVDTGKLTVLKSLEWRDTYSGNFSPDGKWLVYSTQVGDEIGVRDLGVFTIAVDGSVEHTLVGRPMAAGAPFFTPDGSRVVFAGGDGIVGIQGVLSVTAPRQKTLYGVRVADGKPLGAPEGIRSNISSGFFSGFLLGFSRDGSIYYDEIQDKNFISVADLDAATWKPEGTPTAVSDPFRQRSPTAPAWSPDGKKVAYVDNESENVLVIHDMQSGEQRTYSSGSVHMTFWGWTPDGRSVLLNGAPQGLRLLNLETRRERPIPVQTAAPMLSRDGKSILFVDVMNVPPSSAADTARTVQLKRHHLETGTEEVVRSLTVQGTVRSPRLSPDGRMLAMMFAAPGEKTAALRVVPLDGGPVRVFDAVPPATSLAFTPDGSAVLFTKANEMWVQPLAGGEAYATGLRMRGLNAITVNPEGRLAFYWSEVVRHVWAYRNLVP